jgi:hypothetical protein
MHPASFKSWLHSIFENDVLEGKVAGAGQER